ncbi:MAG: hypothetical protein J6L79_05785 [Muribaculaceae bacterium]|nr:hypothetical protein [Muribaculaceae bacterium]
MIDKSGERAELIEYEAQRSVRKEMHHTLGVPEGCLSGGFNVLYHGIVPP